MAPHCFARVLPILGLLAAVAGCSDRSGDSSNQTAGIDVATPVAEPTMAGRRIDREADRFDFSHTGTLAPAISFSATDGKTLTLAHFRGQPVLVNLWATWCVPCVKEMPAFDKLASAYKGRLAVIAIDQDQTERPAVLHFWRASGFKTLRTYLDPTNALATAIGMAGLPATVLYDKDGKEVWRASGGTDWASPLVAEMIAKAGK